MVAAEDSSADCSWACGTPDETASTETIDETLVPSCARTRSPDAYNARRIKVMPDCTTRLREPLGSRFRFASSPLRPVLCSESRCPYRGETGRRTDRKSTRLNSSHLGISY